MIRFDQITIDASTMTIRNGNRAMYFAKARGPEANVRFKIFKYMLLTDGRGISKERLFEAVYSGDPEGGPISGTAIIDIALWNWGARIHNLGFEVKREKRAGTIYLRMVPVNVV